MLLVGFILSAGLLVAVSVAFALYAARNRRTVAALKRSETRLQNVIENLPMGIAIADEHARILNFNSLARPIADLVPESEARKSPAAFGKNVRLFDERGERVPFERFPSQRVLRGETFQDYEISLESDGAEARHLSFSGARLNDDDGALLLLAFVDVTERRRDERERRLEQERFEVITRTVPGMIGSFRMANDGAMTFPYSSPKAVDLFGLHPGTEVDAATVFGRIHADDVDRFHASVLASRESLEPWLEAVRYDHPERGEIWLEGHSVPARDAEGVTWHGVLTDVTQRKAAEARLLSQERLLRQMGEIAQIGGWTYDVKTGEGEWTVEVAHIHDVSTDVAPSRDFGLKFYPPEARVTIDAALRAAEADGIPFDLTLPFVSAKKRHKWIRTICQPVVEDGRVVRVRGAFIDVTATKRREKLQRLEHDATRIIAEATTVTEVTSGVLALVATTLDWEAAELWTVDRIQRSLRCAEVFAPDGSPCEDFLSERRDLRLGAQAASGLLAAEGPAVRWVTDPASDPAIAAGGLLDTAGFRAALTLQIRPQRRVAGLMTFFSTRPRAVEDDVLEALTTVATQLAHFVERADLEAQFRRTQRMEALGVLAGGVAHDFNNILTGIIATASLALSTLETSDPLYEDIKAIDRAAYRAAELVRQILMFSRSTEVERKRIDLGDVLTETTSLLRASIPATVEVGCTSDEHAPAVLANAGQIHQVLMNLGTNAFQALPDAHGRIDLALERCEIDQVHASERLQPGTYARLSVRDDGIGMDEETLQRIFEPFFTTKNAGQGTGLGLSMVHGAMESHGGAVLVHSRPGAGTRFDLYLPADEDTRETIRSAREAQAATRGEGRRILLVDDEAVVVDAFTRALRTMGYAVEAAHDPEIGWKKFEASPEAFDVVVTDLTMPGSTGIELTSRVRSVRDNIPVILTTGFAGALTPERLEAARFDAVLYKPLSGTKLCQAVGEVLGRRLRNASPPEPSP
ncbi:MAG: ATP-binding protein [Deltaproteobacteria bacterium]